MKTTPIKYAIHGTKESPIFGEGTIHIAADDEAGGVFFVLTAPLQEHTVKDGLRITIEELRAVLAAAEKMQAEFDAIDKSI